MKQPMQPLTTDDKGTLRFHENAIVRWLLDNGDLTMNDIAAQDFSREDREQFAQLIGYSHSGSGTLGYMTDEVWNAALAAHEGADPWQARANALGEQLAAVKEGMRKPLAELYGMHEDDFGA